MLSREVAIVYRSADAGLPVNTIQIGPNVASVKSGRAIEREACCGGDNALKRGVRRTNPSGS